VNRGLGLKTKRQKQPITNDCVSKFYMPVPVKVHMGRNQCFNILKVQHFKYPIPKFQPRLKKIGDFIMPESCAILLSILWYSNRAAKMSGHVA